MRHITAGQIHEDMAFFNKAISASCLHESMKRFIVVAKISHLSTTNHQTFHVMAKDKDDALRQVDKQIKGREYQIVDVQEK